MATKGYGQSKTANALFAVTLDERGEAHRVRAFSVHPGAVMTELVRSLPPDELATIRASVWCASSTRRCCARRRGGWRGRSWMRRRTRRRCGDLFAAPATVLRVAKIGRVFATAGGLIRDVASASRHLDLALRAVVAVEESVPGEGAERGAACSREADDADERNGGEGSEEPRA
jgi:NAD(P)-dependent dehydrogenase (short-subunit alcohol dehydrogenase family)